MAAAAPQLSCDNPKAAEDGVNWQVGLRADELLGSLGVFLMVPWDYGFGREAAG